MSNSVRIVYEYKTGHWYKLWKVFFGNTLLLQTEDEQQAKRAYEKYKQNPPVFDKIPDVIF